MSGTNRAENEEGPEPAKVPTDLPDGPPEPREDGTDFGEVKQLGLVAAIASLSYVFWICGGMEMIERLAFYGVRAVSGIYVTDPASKGGLAATPSQYGTILVFWALFQNVVAVLTGGLSDRYGYKETIFVSTVVKISGYLTMAFFPTYAGFFVGAILLATGTAIFKPGIQGTLVRSTTKQNSSMAWGIFYQTVNIGGFLGPLLAGYMRKMAWSNVFFACAAIICLNFLMLLTYKEPGKEERLERARLEKANPGARKDLIAESLLELRKPHVWTYLVVFSGFWLLFYALFDVLPLHIQDWVDTRGIVSTLFGTHGTTNPVVKFFIVMNKDGTEIQPEGMLNLNAGLIMLTCFLFALLSGKMRATTSMVIGTLLATVAIILSGSSTLGWISVGAIAIFSVGEMLSSPKFSEFIGNFAPADKKAMYIGFAQAPVATGMAIEGKLGSWLYDHFASKERFAREMLADKGLLAGQALTDVKQGEAFAKLVELSHIDKWELTHQLYTSHNVGMVWYIMAGVGVLTAFGIYVYGQWVARLKKGK